MKIASAYRRNRWSAFIVVLLAATLFAANPIVSLAHLLSAHGATSAQSEDGQESPHAPLCKLCVGFVAGSAAADNYVPSMAVLSLPQASPEAAPAGLLRPVPFAPYRSRAPPIH
jgi:hypothetical protein